LTDHEPCAVLPWDSEFFDLRIGRVISPVLTPADTAAAERWARHNRVVVLYALVDINDHASRASVEASGFRAVDTRLTLRRTVGPPVAAVEDVPIRQAAASDAHALGALARQSHRNTRFYADGGFDRDRCDELYAVWLVQALSEDDAIVFAAVDDGVVTGYFSLHQLSSPECRVGLVAVAPEARGRGVGRALMAAAVRSAAQHGAKEMSVVTQGDSTVAVHYYESAGFRPVRAEVWYHRWF